MNILSVDTKIINNVNRCHTNMVWVVTYFHRTYGTTVSVYSNKKAAHDYYMYCKDQNLLSVTIDHVPVYDKFILY